MKPEEQGRHMVGILSGKYVLGLEARMEKSRGRREEDTRCSAVEVPR